MTEKSNYLIVILWRQLHFMFNNSKKLAFICLLTMVSGSVLLDQLTKSWATDKFMTWQHAENLMAYHGRYEELLSVPSSASESKDVSWYLKFGFNYVRNQGAAWGMFSDMSYVDEKTPVYAVIHEVQKVEFDLEPSETDILVDKIFTNKASYNTDRILLRPKGIYWEKLEDGMLESTPPLQELKEILQR